jgi:hypothetical protein
MSGQISARPSLTVRVTYGLDLLFLRRIRPHDSREFDEGVHHGHNRCDHRAERFYNRKFPRADGRGGCGFCRYRLLSYPVLNLYLS